MRQIDISTPRLILRRWQDEDLEAFVRMNADPVIMRYFPAPFSREQTLASHTATQKELAERGYGLYAAENRASGRFMGYIGFHHATLVADFTPCVEIGWRLHSDFWNRGYATEGARACLAHGFGTLGFERVYSFTAVYNGPSQRVMQKCGMRFDRHFDHPRVPEQHVLRPHVLYVAEKESWS